MVYAHFESAKQVEARAYNVWQYDWGQKLQITGLESLDLPNHVQIQFAIDGEETATTRIATVTRGILIADIPFKCLQDSKKVFAYIYILNADADGGQTIKQVTFVPRKRQKPDDDITPDEERTVDAMVNVLNAATEKANIDVTAAAESAAAAAANKKAAAESEAAAAVSAKAAAESAAAAAEDQKKVAKNTEAVSVMYNNLTINIDGGDATHVDIHIIDGGTASTTP